MVLRQGGTEPIDSENLSQKLGKIGKKGEQLENMENQRERKMGRRGKKDKATFTMSLLTERAGYATGASES